MKTREVGAGAGKLEAGAQTETAAAADGVAAGRVPRSQRSPEPRPRRVLQARGGWLRALDIRELWLSRELVLFFAERDIKVRYKQTVFGVLWAIIQPVLVAAIFAVTIGKITKSPSHGIPYIAFVFAGLVLFSYVSNATDAAARSLVRDRALVTQVYFPRLLAPLAGPVAGLPDLLITLVILAVVMAIVGVGPGLAVLLVPVWIASALLVAIAAGTLLCALNVEFRDVQYALPLLLQLWLFASPVIYPPSVIRGTWIYLYALNPMVGVLEGFRWSVLGAPAPGSELFVSLGALTALLMLAMVYFGAAERRFADVI